MIKIKQLDKVNKKIIYEDFTNKFKKYRPVLLDKEKKGIYQLPLNYWTLSLLEEHVQNNFEFSSILNEYKNFSKKINDFKTSDVEKQIKIIEDKNIIFNSIADDILYEYQKVDAYLMSKNKSFANLNCMRSGKTHICSASLQLILEKNPFQKVILSIIQATSLQWIDSLKKICPKYKIVNMCHEQNKDKRKEMYLEFIDGKDSIILLTTKDKLKKDIESTKKTKTFLVSRNQIKNLEYGLVTDEVHFTRNHTTIQSKVHFFLSQYASFRWGLTGTKISNEPIDLYGLMRYLKPDIYKNYYEFGDRYFLKERKYYSPRVIWEYSDLYENNKAELFGLINLYSIERTEEEVLYWVPKMIEHEPVLLELKPHQKRIYQALLNEMPIYVNDKNGDINTITTQNHLALRTKLLQCSSTPKAIDSSINEISNKEEWILKFLDKNIPLNKKVVIFGRYSKTVLKPLVELLKQKYIVGLIDGTVKDKSIIQQEFQNNKYQVLVCNIQSGGTGLALDVGDIEIFLERDDNLANNEQAKKRILNTRKDDKRQKEVYNLISSCSASADLVQYAAQLKKQEWVSELYPDNMTKNLINWELQLYNSKQILSPDIKDEDEE